MLEREREDLGADIHDAVSVFSARLGEPPSSVESAVIHPVNVITMDDLDGVVEQGVGFDEEMDVEMDNFQ